VIKAIFGLLAVLVLAVVFVVLNQSDNLDVSEGISEISLPTSIFDDDVYQFSIKEIPSGVKEKVVQAAISRAVQMWGQNNPELEFEQVESGGDFSIHWFRTISGEHSGLQEGSKIEIELGTNDCRGDWNQYSAGAVADTIAHEIGHYLGLEHHSSEDHLMYGLGDEFTQDPFDDLGYIIPKPDASELNWIEYERLDKTRESLDSEISVLGDRLDALSAIIDSYPQTITDSAQYEEYLDDYDLYDDVRVQYNEKIADHSVIITEMNCIADVDL